MFAYCNVFLLDLASGCLLLPNFCFDFFLAQRAALVTGQLLLFSFCSSLSCHPRQPYEDQTLVSLLVLGMQGDPRKYATYLATRPKSFEAEAVRLLLDVLRSTKHQAMKPGFWLLIVHLANADLLKEIKDAKAEGRVLLI